MFNTNTGLLFCFVSFCILDPTKIASFAPRMCVRRKIIQCLLFSFDSSSLTNEKDHHYFLNSADVCW